MALNYNYGDVKDYKTVCLKPNDDPMDVKAGYKFKIRPVTDALIWATMAVGFDEISKTNYYEFWLRLNFVEEHQGNYITKWDEKEQKSHDYYITLEDVKKHIGMWTNANRVARGKWWGVMVKKLCETHKKYNHYTKHKVNINK